MRKITTRLLPILSLLCTGLIPDGAWAAGGDKSYVSAALTKTQDVSRADSSKGEDVVTIMNISAAFAMGSGFALGLKYFDYSQDGKFLEDENLVIAGYGPMVGYMHASGIYANLAYLISPTKSYKHDRSKTKYEGGNGYVLDVGKMWEFGSSFGAGVALSQSKVTYKEATTDGTETDLDGEWSDSSFYPYLSFFVFF